MTSLSVAVNLDSIDFSTAFDDGTPRLTSWIAAASLSLRRKLTKVAAAAGYLVVEEMDQYMLALRNRPLSVALPVADGGRSMTMSSWPCLLYTSPSPRD